MANEQITLLMAVLTAISTLALVITTIIYTKHTGKLAKSEFGPKLYIYTEQILANSEWDKSIMLDFCEEVNTEISGEGFVDSNDWYKWKLILVNNGKAPATDIEISYTIKAYKNQFKLGADKWSWNSGDYSPVIHKKVSRNLSINYLPPDNKKEFIIFYMASFPEAQLEVDKLKCSEDIFIKKNTVIERYIHPEFDFIISPSHARKLLGVNK